MHKAIRSTAHVGAVRIQNKHGQDMLDTYEPSWQEVERAVFKDRPALWQLAEEADLLSRAYGWV